VVSRWRTHSGRAYNALNLIRRRVDIDLNFEEYGEGQKSPILSFIASSTTGYSILFISLSAEPNNLEADWAEAGGGPIRRQCPICRCDSIIGHGRRRKQAQDEDHDWIRFWLNGCRAPRE
jgi:hypothetical protein